MTEFLRIQIRIILPDGEGITVPVDNGENFKDFQERVLQTHGLGLEREFFNFENNIINEDDSIAGFLRSYNNLEDQTDIIYEIRLQNVEETAKNDTVQYGQATAENFIAEVDNFNPLIGLNSVTESSRVINVLSENIFENDSETNELGENFIIANNPQATLGDQVYNYMDIESKLREIHDTDEELVTDLCRLCAKNLRNDERVLIYGEQNRFDEKINGFLPIRVGVDDGLPHQMCGECSGRLRNFSDFCQTVQQADKILRLKFMNSNATDSSQEKPESQNASQTDIEKETPQCRFCQTTIPEITAAISHSANSHSNISGLNVCVLCDFGFISLNLLKEHVYETHKTNFPVPKAFQCKVCLQKFNVQSLLEKHICVKESRNLMMLHCEICNHVFLSKARLNFHRQFHLKNKHSLYCFECKLTFNDENDHFNHVSCFHNMKQIFPCDFCDKTFRKSTILDIHKGQHANEHKCDLCLQVFSSGELLKEHEPVHKDAKHYPCGTCGKNFLRTNQLRKHLLKHDTNPIVDDVYVCSICKRCFSNEKDGKKHEESKHNKVSSVEVVVTDRVFQCEFCEECYVTTEALKMHKYYHKEAESYNCQVCRKNFSTFSKCITHQMTHHSQEDEEKSDDFPIEKHFLCEYCGRSYLQWNNLNFHRRLKHPEKFELYTCPECNGQFASMANYNLHRKTFHSHEMFKCEDCGKSMNNMRALQIHKAMQHSDSKDLKCSICDKVFAYQVSLDAHMKTHTKVFKCIHCPKTFTNNNGLVIHMKTHRENNKNCLHCGKKFQTAFECSVHEKTHKKFPFNCEICDKEFPTKPQLIDHSKIHTSSPQQQLFYCDVCGLCFKRAATLKSHKSKHYKDKSSGSFVLMVDMKDEPQDKPTQPTAQLATPIANALIQNSNFIFNSALPDNYIDIGNGQYLKVQGNSVNIDGKDYLVIDQNGKTVETNEEFQMVVDDYADSNVVAPELDNAVMVVDNQNQIILNENQINQPEYVFATEDTIGKPGTTYVIDGNHFILGTDDQVTFS